MKKFKRHLPALLVHVGVGMIVGSIVLACTPVKDDRWMIALFCIGAVLLFVVEGLDDSGPMNGA